MANETGVCDGCEVEGTREGGSFGTDVDGASVTDVGDDGLTAEGDEGRDVDGTSRLGSGGKSSS